MSSHAYPRSQRTENGFTLIELMISVALGLILIAGLVTAFLGSNRSSKLNATLTELQESGRFALDTIIRDVRMAGFQGCASISELPAKVRANSAPTENYYDDSLRAYAVDTATSWDPMPHATFNIPTDIGTPVPGTHALSVQFGSSTTYQISPMGSTSSAVTVIGDDVDIATGDLALISDCNSADIFQVTADNANVLQHDAAPNGGDNRLTAPYGQGEELNRSRIMRFQANIYYIGETGRTDKNNSPVRALYRQTLPYTNPPIEISDGIENLRIRLGIEDPDNEGPLTFVSPDNALLETHRVKSIQVGFLMQSYDDVSDENDNRSYEIAGYSIPASDATATDGNTHTADKKMRLTFNGTVSLRNR